MVVAEEVLPPREIPRQLMSAIRNRHVGRGLDTNDSRLRVALAAHAPKHARGLRRPRRAGCSTPDDGSRRLRRLPCLVTGGLGFIGSHLAARLVELGAEVTIIDSLIPDYGGNLYNVRDIENRVRISFTDIRDPWSMRYLVEGQDFIFNLAGQVSHIDSMEDPQTDLDINCKAQLSPCSRRCGRPTRTPASSSPPRASSTGARSRCRSPRSTRWSRSTSTGST